MCCAELRNPRQTQLPPGTATGRGRKSSGGLFPIRVVRGPYPGMHDDRAERLRQRELLRKAEAEQQTLAARCGFLRRFELEADPDRQLPEEERRARGVALRREYMRKLAAKSARVRKERSLRLRIGDRQRDSAAGPSPSRLQTRAGASEGRRAGDERGTVRRRAAADLYGRWRITRMDLWEQHDVELFGPAITELDEDGTGTMAFEFVVASLDHRAGDRVGVPAIEFSWDGSDGRSRATGRGGSPGPNVTRSSVTSSSTSPPLTPPSPPCALPPVGSEAWRKITAVEISRPATRNRGRRAGDGAPTANRSSDQCLTMSGTLRQSVIARLAALDGRPPCGQNRQLRMVFSGRVRRTGRADTG